MKVLVRSSLQSGTVLGYDSYELIRALVRAGMTVFLDPIDVEAPLPHDIAALLTQRHPPEYDLAIDYVDLERIGITPKLRRKAHVAVAWVWYGQDSIDKHGLRVALSRYDVLVAADEVTYGALSPYTVPYKGSEALKLILVPSGFDAEFWHSIPRNWEGQYGFLVVSQDDRNENLEAIVDAFNRLRQDQDYENCRMMIKTIPDAEINDALKGAVPNLHITKANWDKDTYKSYYGLFHTIVSAATGGFKNLHALEFQTTGGTAIATNWSMNRNWLGSYAHALAYDLQPFDSRKRNQLHAVVHPDTIRVAMAKAMDSRSSEAERGRTASEVIPVMMGWEESFSAFFLRISNVLPDKGRILRDLFLRLAPIQEEKSAWKI